LDPIERMRTRFFYVRSSELYARSSEARAEVVTTGTTAAFACNFATMAECCIFRPKLPGDFTR